MIRVGLTPVDWDGRASADLTRAVDDLNQSEAAVRRGDETLYAILLTMRRDARGGFRMGSVLARIEDGGPEGRDLVITGIGGRARGARSLYRQVLPALETLARHFGAVAIRAHTVDEPRGRLVRSVGFRKSETVWRRQVA